MEMSALDFCRALNERGRFARLIFRLVAGKFAYREFEIMEAHLNLQYDTHSEYGLEDCEYHKKSMKQIINGLKQ